MLSRAGASSADAEVVSSLRAAEVRSCSADAISIVLAGPAGPAVLDAARSLVERSAAELLGRCPSVDVSSAAFAGGAARDVWLPAPVLNPAYTFDNFVIGPSNRLAHAAALAVSDAPGQAYNPLFIHSASGMGKSHLLQAICRRAMEKHKNLALAYISCEDFQNLFFSAVQSGRLEALRNRFRCVEMLVVDDVHFLANRERTQEEFFHTFNALYNAARQIVLSCDCPPREIPQIQERLVSRFKWGLVAEIEPPEFETRLEIVKMKTQLRGLSLSPAVMERIAASCDGSIRELEGCILKIVGYASLLGAPVDEALADEVLSGLSAGRVPQRQPSIEEILAAVADHYGLAPAQIQTRSRARSVALPRQICMYLARELTGHSLQSLGTYFGGRDHSTVKHACDKIARLVEAGGDVSAAVQALRRKLKTGKP